MAHLITGPADWRAKDMADTSQWILNLTKDQIAGVDRALKTAKASGGTLTTLTKESFPLPGFEPLFADVLDRVENGRGVAVVRGLPALDYDKDDLRMIYWGLGLHVGVAVSQSSKGDLLGDVMNFGQDPRPGVPVQPQPRGGDEFAGRTGAHPLG